MPLQRWSCFDTLCFVFSHIGRGHRDRVCIMLEPAQLLKGDIMVEKLPKIPLLFKSFHLIVWSITAEFPVSMFSFCRLNAITKVMQRRNVKLFSGCSSTREQCRATTWCLRKRTWRQPTKVDLLVGGCGGGGVPKQVPTCSSYFTAVPLLLAYFFFLLQGLVWTPFRLGTLKPIILFSQNMSCVLRESHWWTTTFTPPFLNGHINGIPVCSHSRSQICRLR